MEMTYRGKKWNLFDSICTSTRALHRNEAYTTPTPCKGETENSPRFSELAWGAVSSSGF